MYYLPSEKKSTANAADTLGVVVGRDGALSSSSEIFVRPFFSEGGRKTTELIAGAASSWSLFNDIGADSDSDSSPSMTGAVGVIDDLVILNTSPGPLPPPKTRSGGGATAGPFCFGAGSIDKSAEAPAPFPESKRGFFAAGLSSSSPTSSLGSPDRVGGPIVIFLGPRFVLGGGKERPPLPFGSAIVDFFAGGGNFEARGDLEVEGVG